MIQIEDLELRINNPFSIGNIFIFDEGDYILDRESIQVEKSIRDRYHTIIDDETLGTIAFNFYGNSKWWWVIADVNNISWPFKLETGLTILIPDINKVNLSI